MTSQAIKQRAKAIFASKFNYPAVPFRSIGRDCFAWSLQEARRQLADAERFAAIPADTKAARVAGQQRRAALTAEIARLSR